MKSLITMLIMAAILNGCAAQYGSFAKLPDDYKDQLAGDANLAIRAVWPVENHHFMLETFLTKDAFLAGLLCRLDPAWNTASRTVSTGFPESEGRRGGSARFIPVCKVKPNSIVQSKQIPSEAPHWVAKSAVKKDKFRDLVLQAMKVSPETDEAYEAGYYFLPNSSANSRVLIADHEFHYVLDKIGGSSSQFDEGPQEGQIYRLSLFYGHESLGRLYKFKNDHLFPASAWTQRL